MWSLFCFEIVIWLYSFCFAMRLPLRLLKFQLQEDTFWVLCRAMDSTGLAAALNLLYLQARNIVIRSLDLPSGWMHGIRKLYRKFLLLLRYLPTYLPSLPMHLTRYLLNDIVAQCCRTIPKPRHGWLGTTCHYGLSTCYWYLPTCQVVVFHLVYLVILSIQTHLHN